MPWKGHHLALEKILSALASLRITKRLVLLKIFDTNLLIFSLCAASETVLRVDELDATIQMMLYTNHTYLQVYSSAPSIELRHKVRQRSATGLNLSGLYFCSVKRAPTNCAQVYVEVTVTQPADFFLLLINKCWATQTPQPNATEGSHHTLLQNGSDQLSTSAVHHGLVSLTINSSRSHSSSPHPDV